MADKLTPEQHSFKASALLKMHSAESLDWAITHLRSRRVALEGSPLKSIFNTIISVLEIERDLEMKNASEFMQKLEEPVKTWKEVKPKFPEILE